MVDAICRGKAESFIGAQARLLSTLHGMFPGMTSELMALVNRLLPAGTSAERRTGRESETPISRSFLHTLGRRAAVRFNQSRPDGGVGPAIVPR